MVSSNADTPRARALGAQLREARKDRGFTTRKLAELIGRNDSHISRWENGRLIPSPEDTATVLAVLGVSGGDRERLLELARDALDPNWIAPGVDRQLAALTEYERTAKRMTNVEPLIIPGLLQTYDYARHIMTAFGNPRGEAEQRATLRVGRQHVLTDTPPTNLVAIIGEYALRYSVCPNDVMLAQLEHLLRNAELASVEIRIVPLATPTPAMLNGSWALLEFDRAKPVVHHEHFRSSATITEVKSVEKYRASVETLFEVAMSPDQSRELIAEVIKCEEKAT